MARFSDERYRWPVRLVCGHDRLVTEVDLYAGFAACPQCPSGPSPLSPRTRILRRLRILDQIP